VTELDAGLVRRTLAVIVRNLADLAQVEGLSIAEYRRDRFRQKGVDPSARRTDYVALFGAIAQILASAVTIVVVATKL
jgi:hypothetical protein